MSNSCTSRSISFALIGFALLIGARTFAKETSSEPGQKSVATAATPAPMTAASSSNAKPAEKGSTGKDLKITLKWSTASEVDNYGYFVYRGEEEKGPFKVLNERAIPGAGNSEVPRDYRYEDHDVAFGKSYYYYLESVSTVGVKEKFSPILKRECCKVPGAKEVGKGESSAKKKDEKQEGGKESTPRAKKAPAIVTKP